MRDRKTHTEKTRPSKRLIHLEVGGILEFLSVVDLVIVVIGILQSSNGDKSTPGRYPNLLNYYFDYTIV